MIRALPTTLLLLCSACGPVYYAPPAQRVAQKHIVAMLLDMTPGRPAEAWGTIVSGVHSGGDPNADWRWVGPQSVFTFNPGKADGWSLAAHVTAVQANLDKTGPQKVEFQVNGKTVGKADLSVSRRYDLKFPLDPGLLKDPSHVEVRMLASPCLPAQYSPPLCVLLHSIGLVREPQ